MYDDEIDIPKELIEKNQDLTLCLDIMFVNGIPMLTSIDRTIRYRPLIPLKNRESKELYWAIDAILRNYNQAGFSIKQIFCDQEFEELMEQVNDELDIKMDYTSSGEHVPEAERNNRTIGERMRAIYHNLPY